jgi:hypothetical protein
MMILYILLALLLSLLSLSSSSPILTGNVFPTIKNDQPSRPSAEEETIDFSFATPPPHHINSVFSSPSPVRPRLSTSKEGRTGEEKNEIGKVRDEARDPIYFAFAYAPTVKDIDGPRLLKNVEEDEDKERFEDDTVDAPVLNVLDW